MALEIRHCACGLTPFAIVRSSLLAGEFEQRFVETTFNNGVVTNVALTNRDEQHTLVVTEIQFGAEWSRCTQYGLLYVRAAVEGQLWDRGASILDTSSSDREEDEAHLTIIGGSLAVGLRR